MTNITEINFKDTIISQWEDAIDKESAQKTLAFKYFNGNKEALNNYLFPNDEIEFSRNTFCFANCRQLELL
tara:strand:+ start:492 stop:704 length:213 start_codon:yes stop_codon:yes gene_type:complete